MCKPGLYYQFQMHGQSYEIHEVDVAYCLPSVAKNGTCFFTLKDGTNFRGENVQEVIKQNLSPLERYRTSSYL